MNIQPSKIVCVGRNYAAHAAELGNAVPDSPILFIKPPSSLRSTEQGIVLPANVGECHYETELCFQIAHPLSNASHAQALSAISGVTLGLDLTLRDVQNQLKAKGHPWERAKAFDGSCILAPWLALDMLTDLKQATFSLTINGELRQAGNTADMLFGVVELVSHISHVFSLQAGDVIMTGTPEGVAALQHGDQLALSLDTLMGAVVWNTSVIS